MAETACPECDRSCPVRSHDSAYCGACFLSFRPSLQVTLHETGELRTEPLPEPAQHHETVRLFEPAPVQMPGQTSLEL